MKDPTTIQSIKPHFTIEQEHLNCPRCNSNNTKFCYYNNYNFSQPRHFCKNCRRYWTKGGALRNVPVGGGTRKNKQRPNPKRSSTAPQPVPKLEPPSMIYPLSTVIDQSFSSLLNSNGQFGNLLESMNSISSSVQRFSNNPISGTNSNLMGNPGLDLQNKNNPETFSGLQSDSSSWGGGNGWPDLAIYTPGSNFQ